MNETRTQNIVLSHPLSAQEWDLPDAVQYVARWEDSHVDVGHDDIVKVPLSLVREEQIRHPDFARVVEGQVFHPAYA